MKPHLVLNDEEKQQRLDDDVAVGNGVGNVVDGDVDDGDTGVQVQECAQMGENLIKKLCLISLALYGYTCHPCPCIGSPFNDAIQGIGESQRTYIQKAGDTGVKTPPFFLPISVARNLKPFMFALCLRQHSANLFTFWMYARYIGCMPEDLLSLLFVLFSKDMEGL